MQLEIQTHSGIKVVAEVPKGASKGQVAAIVDDALETARTSSECWAAWMKEHETSEEREMRVLNEEMQRRQLAQMKAQLAARDVASDLLQGKL